MKLFFNSILILLISSPAFGQHQWKTSQLKSSTASISDSINLIKHTLYLDITGFENQEKYTACTIDFASKVDSIVEIPLDLKNQVVDSVVHSSGLLDFTYAEEKLTVQLPVALYTGMADQITIYYKGGEVTDPSGFGGFYFDPSIAYNIGVAFSDWPPSYGRAWFPCFDNFVEKSIFEFQVLTSGGRSSWCNGYRQSIDTLSADTILTTWIMDNEISSYLASVVVADYEETVWEFESITGDTIPVYLVGPESQLGSMEANFENLNLVFDAFEDWFGPYRWPKIGYTLTPVGAMEHSTNIAYPPSLLGTSSAEPVMAHELAHEWFGNLVTCDHPSDMWLNEGWSEFLSILAYEAISDPQEYKERMRINHRNMLHKAHLLDGDYLTMNAIPPELTYGEHVYNKGACMAHSLRGYIGDELFFDIMEEYLETFAFENASSEDLRDFITTHPLLDVTDFFNDWISQPGWAQFSVDELSAESEGDEFLVTVGVRQRLRAAPDFYQNVPLTLTLLDENWNVYEQSINVSGAWSAVYVTAPFEPVYAILNRDEKLTYATTASEEILASTGMTFWNHAYANVTVTEVDEPVPLRIAHHWVGPGGDTENEDILVSPDRYWRIGGMPDDNFSADVRFDFDGRDNASGNLDPALFAAGGENFNEENLVLLYRSTPSDEWQLWNDFTLQTLGSASNGHARLTAHNITMGEYTFGYPDAEVGIENIEAAGFSVFPNPATESLYIDFSNKDSANEIRMYHSDGKMVRSERITGTHFTLDVSALARGTYILEITTNGILLGREQVVLQ